ncbi:MAG: signal recognition particle-docking protein FtsY [Bacteroidia bacterium]
MNIFNIFNKEKKEKLNAGLEKTKTSLLEKIGKAIIGKSTIDDEFLDNLEEILISSDVGINTTLKIIDRLQKRVAQDKFISTSELNNLLKDEIIKLLAENKSDIPIDFSDLKGIKPYVIMVVGVNGVGKTTTIGKLANQFTQAGKKVVLGAGDTFRAAAVEQLKIWGERNNVHVVTHGMNTDPASVAYDTVKFAVEKDFDVAIIDTAGRLHNKIGLMDELSKIRRVVQKFKADAPHEVLLVLDASTGQNAFEQAKHFTNATQVNAIALTKLDGTAKGGVVIGIANEFKVPIKYIGVGEGINDLQLFDKNEFVDSLFLSK